jgi:hypothetical protein
VKLAACDVAAHALPLPGLRACNDVTASSQRARDVVGYVAGGMATSAATNIARTGGRASHRHAAAVLHCCGPSTSSTARCGLVHRHPRLGPLALELADAADAVDARDEAFGDRVGWPPFFPPQANTDAVRQSLDETLGCAVLWRVLDCAGVDLGVLSGEPFTRQGSVCWPRLGCGGGSDWTGCAPSARLWHTALANCFGAAYSPLRLAAGSVLMREIARCINRHAPPRPPAEEDLEPAWPPLPQPSLIGAGASAVSALAAATTAAAAYQAVASNKSKVPGAPPGYSRAEWNAATKEAVKAEDALPPAERQSARSARVAAQQAAWAAARVVAEVAADEAAFAFEWEVRRLQEAPPPPPRVSFDPQARIAGWEVTLLTLLLASFVPARWAAQAEMAAVLVEELGCDASAPIAAGGAGHAVHGAAVVPVDTAVDYTLMHAAAAVWLAGLGGAPRREFCKSEAWTELYMMTACAEGVSVPLQPHQAPTPPPRVAAAALRYIVDRVPALGAALRVRRSGIVALADPDDTAVQEDPQAKRLASDTVASATAAHAPGPNHEGHVSNVDVDDSMLRGAAAAPSLPPLALPRLQLPPLLEAAGLSPVEAALVAAPHVPDGPFILRFISVVQEIVASGDRDEAAHYLGVDLPRLTSALLPVWAASDLVPICGLPHKPQRAPEPAVAAAEGVVKELQRIRSGKKWHGPYRAQPVQAAVTRLGPAPPAPAERWLRLQTQAVFHAGEDGDGSADAACLALATATHDELRGCLRKTTSALRAARTAAGDAYIPNEVCSTTERSRQALAMIPRHMANALALLAEWGRRKPGGAAAVACAHAAARGCPPPAAWWPTPPQLAEDGDTEVAAAAAEVAVAGVLHGWPAGDVWLALGLVGAAGQAAWLRRLVAAELERLYAPAESTRPPMSAWVPLPPQSPLLALRHPTRLAALRMVLQHPGAAAALDNNTLTSLLRLPYKLGPSYARLLLEASAAAVTPTQRLTCLSALSLLLAECGALSGTPPHGQLLEREWQKLQRGEAMEQQRRRVLAAAAVMLDQARQPDGKDGGMRALMALRQPGTGRTLLHLASAAHGRLPRLLIAALPELATLVNTADASGGTPLQAVCSSCHRTEGLLHLVRCGGQVHDDTGGVLAAALPTSALAHDRCVLLDAFAAEGALVMLAAPADGVDVNSEPNAVLGPLRHLLARAIDPMLLRRLLSWVPACLDAWAGTLVSQCEGAASYWVSSTSYVVADMLSRLYRLAEEPSRALLEAVRGGMAPVYVLPRMAVVPGYTIQWTPAAVSHQRPMLLRELAWARRGPIVALRRRSRINQEAEPTTTRTTAAEVAGSAPDRAADKMATSAARRETNADVAVGLQPAL